MRDVLEMKSKLIAGPNCPSCGVTMIERAARNGRNAGKPFWGCSAFPKCRGTYPYAIGCEKLDELRRAERERVAAKRAEEADPTDDLDFLAFLET